MPCGSQPILTHPSGLYLEMVTEPLLKTSSERQIAEKFPSSVCDYSIKQSITFHLPFRKESKFFSQVHSDLLLLEHRLHGTCSHVSQSNRFS